MLCRSPGCLSTAAVVLWVLIGAQLGPMQTRMSVGWPSVPFPLLYLLTGPGWHPAEPQGVRGGEPWPWDGMGTICLGQSEPGFLLYSWTCRCLLVRRDRSGLPREQVPTGGTALLDPQELPGNAVFLAPWSEVPIGAIAPTPPKLRPESRTCPRGRGPEPRENTSAPKTLRTS